MDSLSDRIIRDPICIRIARKADPKNYAETFNASWLLIRELELRKNIEVTDHRAYFKKVVRNYLLNQYRTDSKQFTVDVQESITRFCPADVEAWCNKRTGNDVDDFYREILTLSIKCKNIEDAIRMTEMHRTIFFNHLKEAKKRFKDDLLRGTDSADTDWNNLV
jgi:hypothetical protein